MQIPPMYSAIKVDGKKLYEYARQGIEVKVEPRNIEIYNIKLLNINIENTEIEFEVSCSKGTYIRVLCEDIAEKLNTVGYMSSLKRTLVDKFGVQNAIDFETLEENKNNIHKTMLPQNRNFCNVYNKPANGKFSKFALTCIQVVRIGKLTYIPAL